MRELGSNTKGAIAEAAIRLAAVRCEIGVYQPLNDHSRADLMFEVGPGLYRVQVKWGRLSPDSACVIVHTGGFRLSSQGPVRSTYSEDEIDLFAVYAGELDRSFLLPPAVFANRHAVQLRLTPPRNNQRACINLADDFVFEGAIAQLEERLRGTQEVGGSSPPSSISSSAPEPAPPLTVGSNPFRNHFGYWIDVVAAGQDVVVTRRGKPRLRLTPA
jgi:prevent-host-death family protein